MVSFVQIPVIIEEIIKVLTITNPQLMVFGTGLLLSSSQLMLVILSYTMGIIFDKKSQKYTFMGGVIMGSLLILAFISNFILEKVLMNKPYYDKLEILRKADIIATALDSPTKSRINKIDENGFSSDNLKKSMKFN